MNSRAGNRNHRRRRGRSSSAFTADAVAVTKPMSVVEVLESKVRNADAGSRKVEYATETLRPIVCLAFVLPLVLWYEIGIAFSDTAIRSGIDRWVQNLLSPMGGAHVVVLPLLTVAALLVWHHKLEQRWSFRASTLLWMVGEAVGLALILFLVGDAIILYFDDQAPRPLAGLATLFVDANQHGRFLECLGTGIHEELVFRLILFCPLTILLVHYFKNERVAMIGAAVIVSLLFALLHCDAVNPEGFPFQVSSFLFRFVASVILCILFRFRGFAIAVGVHAAFDVLAIS